METTSKINLGVCGMYVQNNMYMQNAVTTKHIYQPLPKYVF